MKGVNLDDLQKGDLILVKWSDASDLRLPLDVHKQQPDVYVKDWGVYAGISGRRRKHILLAKDVVEKHGEWGVTRIPVQLIDEILVIVKADELVRIVPELGLLARRIRIRKYKREVL